MAITPELVMHQRLQDEVSSYLEGQGYWTFELTYHSRLPEDMAKRLSRLFEPTALYIRGRADRVACHKTEPIIFEWEAKTHPTNRLHDMTLEALPVCHHLALSDLGVRCLYTYRDEERGYDCGFWIDQLLQLPIRVLMIPADRWGHDLMEFFRMTFPRYFPHVRVVETGRTFGSGDPFFIVDESVVATLRPWRELVDSAGQ